MSGRRLNPRRLILRNGRSLRGTDWKTGILREFGWPHSTAEDIGLGWQRILSHVDHYSQLEPQLLGKVEELIDFLTSEDYGFLTID